MAIAEAPSRSRSRPAVNPGTHDHRDNSHGGRISARDLLDIPALNAVTDHHLLMNLATYDDHPQYFYLAGRASGQTAYGGTASGGDLTLSSTAHATKDRIFFGSAQASAYDELNNRLGIGVAVPTARLHVRGSVAAASYVIGTVTAYDTDWGVSAPPTAGDVTDGNDATFWLLETITAAAHTVTCTVVGTTITPASSFEITHRLYRTGSLNTVGSWKYTVYDSAGNGLKCADQDLDILPTGATPATVTCDQAAGAGTANRIVFSVTRSAGGSGSQIRQPLLSFTGAGGAGEALTIWDIGASALSQISSSGRFITTLAPQFDTVAADAGDIWTATDAAGNADWAALSTLMDADLNAIGALSGTGILQRTAADTWALIAPVRGSIPVGNATLLYAGLAIGVANRVLRSDGVDAAWAQVALATDVSGDLPFASLAQGSALSVLGVTGNAIADLASIVAASDHQVLRRSGTAVAFGAVNLAQAAAVTGTLPIANGGTNKALTLVNGGVVWTDVDSFEVSAAGSAGQVLRSGGAAAPTWSTATYPATAGTSGNVLTSDGTNWTSAAPAGIAFATPTVAVDVTAPNAGVLTTALRSDARLQLSQAIAPTWTGAHIFGAAVDNTPILKINSYGNTVVVTNDFMVVTDTSSNSNTGFVMTFRHPGLAGNVAYTMPASTAQLVGTSETSVLTNKTIAPTGGIRCGATTGTGVKFQNGSSVVQFGMFDMGNLTAQRNYTWPNIAGVVLLDASVIFHLDEIVSLDDDVVTLIGTA